MLTLFHEVEARSRALAEQHAPWPCGRGCGDCCRSLARMPELTRTEWELLKEALLALPATERDACLVRAREQAAALRAEGREGPCQCPLFDAERQICRVYAARPLACRSYGFYAGRSHDAWCGKVAAHVAEVRDELVLGNYDALEAGLARVDAERRDLLAWWEREGPAST